MEIDKCFLNVCDSLMRTSQTMERMAVEQLEKVRQINPQNITNKQKLISKDSKLEEKKNRVNSGDVLNRHISECNFSVRAMNVLHKMEINTVAEICQHSLYEISANWHCGTKTIKEIDKFLKDNGLDWGMDVILPNEQKIPIHDTSFILVSTEQLHEMVERTVKETVKNTLQYFGVEFDKEKARFTPDTKNEYKPLEFWLEKLNVNRSTVWRWQKQGLITPRYIGKKLFFCQADFDKFFEKQ